MNDNQTTEVIRESLTRILENARFSSSPQMSAFLRYVVEEAVAGNADRIKAYSVAVDALGKPASFDAQKDPCVRVLAMRLRESLADYYLEYEEPVVITIPRGSYKPSFAYAANILIAAADNDSTHNSAAQPAENHRDPEAIRKAATQLPEAETHAPSTVQSAVDHGNGSSVHESDAPKAKPSGISRLHTRRWIVAPIVLGLGVWFVTSSLKKPDNDVPLSASISEASLDPRMGAAEQEDLLPSAYIPLRPRPNLPTVHIRARSDSDELLRQIGIAVSGVLAKFKNLVVIRDHIGIRKEDAWPEDYELRGNAVTVNGTIRVNAELIHAATGAIAYTAAFEVAQVDQGDVFTGRIMEMIEAFSAQLARFDGPLVSDYRQRDGIRPELACLYDLQDQHRQESGTGEHEFDQEIEAEPDHTDRCGIIPSLLDNTRISSIMLSVNLELNAADNSNSPQERQAMLETATLLAEQAVSLGPYRADTHALLMNTLRMKGDLKQASFHGARAMELNRFDSVFLRQYAELLSEVDENERAEIVEAMADKLDPTS